ncbi:MAG: Cas10/Cmr2 second palm domain-containing protein [Halorhodospira sp.]
MTWNAWLFEAKSIQEYLFASGRLRDIIGGSELVESLTGELLDDVLEAAQVGEAITFSRRAGGAIYALSEREEAIHRLRDLCSLAVQQHAPGLRFESATGKGDTPLAAFDEARRELQGPGGRLRPQRPATPPVAARSRRTGGAAVHWDRKDGPVDAATKARKAHADAARAGLVDRVRPAGVDIGWRNWPLDMETDFPFQGENRTVALIHADGNGFGQLLRNARRAADAEPERFPELFRRLSEAISGTTESAVQTAVNEVLLPEQDSAGMLPARPIVVGGDDITFLVRADLALPFLRRFTEAFEAASRQALADLAQAGITGEDLPQTLTVGAGCVFMRASQPFSMAHELVEDLTDHAKRAGKAAEPVVSTVAFHRVTTALAGDYDAVLERELTDTWAGVGYRQTLGAYAISEAANRRLPELDDLIALQGVMEEPAMANGAARELLTLIGLAPGQARMRYQRWRRVAREDHDQRPLLNGFDACMERLLEGFDPESADLPFGPGEVERATPLGDVLALKAVGSRCGRAGQGLETSREETA